MPYLQLDISGQYSVESKREFARRLGRLYADIMQTTPDMVDVGVRELAPGSVWRCGQGEPEPAAVLLLDIRRGRPAEQRARLAQALIDVCLETFNLRPDRLNVEFTQHSSDESYGQILFDGAYHGGFPPEWSPEEATRRSMLESIPEVTSALQSREG